MRPARVLGALPLLLALALTAQADPPPVSPSAPPTEERVSVPEVEVRSGPSPQFYPTSKLHRGDSVTVVGKEEGGAWLAIKPPPGSFSWINEKFLTITGPTGVVNGDDVPLRVGSSLTGNEPSVEKVKVKKGTIFTILDPKPMHTNDGDWLPVVPAPQEVRYIPAEAVKTGALVQTTTTAASPVAGAPPAASEAGSPVPPPPTTADNALWQQANQADLARDSATAVRLYRQLAQQTANFDLRMACANRIMYLTQTQLPAALPPTSAPPAPAVAVASAPAPRPAPAPTSPYGQYGPAPAAPPQGQMSQYNPPPAPAPQLGRVQPPTYAPAPAPPPGPMAQWSDAGWLRRAAYYLDNRPTYVLESSQGYPRLYVTAQPGLNLEPYLGSPVKLYGPMVYRGDIKTNYMTAVQVTPLR